MHLPQWAWQWGALCGVVFRIGSMSAFCSASAAQEWCCRCSQWPACSPWGSSMLPVSHTALLVFPSSTPRSSRRVASGFRNRRGLVMGIVTAGGALGQGLLPFAGHIMIDVFGWRLAFAGIGAAMLASLALTLPALRWPSGTRAPITSTNGSPANAVSRQRLTIAFLGTAAFLCCVCMGVPLVHMASFVGMICGSQAIGVTSLLIAMLSGALGRVCFGAAADRIGPLASYAIASSIQTTCVLLFPLFENSVSFMVLSVVFGFGFAGNMTCVSLCVREAVPANRFGGALGVVMMIAWAGMASGGYLGGVLFDAASNYTFSFILAGAAGALNLLVIGALATTRKVANA